MKTSAGRCGYPNSPEPLIEQFDGSEALGTRALVRSSSCCASVTWVCCCARFAICLVERTLRLVHQCLGFLQGSLEIAGIHHRDDLACRHHVAFIDKKLRDAAGKLRVDVDFIGFEATISRGDSGW
jgi:hypothetical protein